MDWLTICNVFLTICLLFITFSYDSQNISAVCGGDEACVVVGVWDLCGI